MFGEAPCYKSYWKILLNTGMWSALKKRSDEDKLDQLHNIIVATINGNPQHATQLAYIIDANHPVHLAHEAQQLKKLLHFYWEVCPKYDERNVEARVILVVFVSLLLLLKFSHLNYIFQQHHP